ncbi:MAG: hypothetical protein HYZ50_20865 [Deltaproteobacteria bacterium]|nr:hypothetical protein [Deltaproteobacteria bacterium]
MRTYGHYRRAYDEMHARLEAEYESLSLQEKSKRVLGRDNPLLYSARVVRENMSGSKLSLQALERGLGRQTPQFESIAYHTLVQAPSRRLELPDARWIFLDFSGQAGGWRYQRAEAVRKFCELIAGKAPETTCRFLSGGVASAEVLDRLLWEEFSQPGSSLRTTARSIHCRFQLWVAPARRAIPDGDCIHIV